MSASASRPGRARQGSQPSERDPCRRLTADGGHGRQGSGRLAEPDRPNVDLEEDGGLERPWHNGSRTDGGQGRAVKHGRAPAVVKNLAGEDGRQQGTGQPVSAEDGSADGDLRSAPAALRGRQGEHPEGAERAPKAGHEILEGGRRSDGLGVVCAEIPDGGRQRVLLVAQLAGLGRHRTAPHVDAPRPRAWRAIRLRMISDVPPAMVSITVWLQLKARSSD